MAKKSKGSDSEGKKKKGEDQVKITKRFKAVINTYKSKAYCHVADKVKGKSISMNSEVVEKLSKKLPSILEKMKNREVGSDDDASSSSSSDSD